MKIITKKKLSQECWNLDYELIKQLNEHLKKNKKEASEVVDLEFKKYEYEKKNLKYSQFGIINRLIDLTDYLLMNYYQDEEMREKIHEAFQIFIHEPVTIVPEIKMLLIGKSEDE